jgi:hypothetical protein
MAKSGTTFKIGHHHSLETIEKIRQKLTGRKMTDEHKENIRKANDGRLFHSMTDAIRKKISEKLKGVPIGKRYEMTDAIRKKMSISGIGKNAGKKHGNWVPDRSKLQKYGDDNKDRRSSAYNSWRREVWKRDGFKCRIADQNCDGRIEAHHILGWIDHPELRYTINNGITLCHFHHPRKRIEEANLSPYFQKLVKNIK